VKKVVLNISDYIYEKLRFEAIHTKQSVLDVLHDRIKAPFHKDIEESYDKWLNQEISKICEESNAPNSML
jgi:hypothetical protein